MTKLNILKKCYPSWLFKCFTKLEKHAHQMISVLISLNIRAMHVTMIFFFFAKLDMLITTIRIITIGTGLLGTIFRIEIVMIKKNFKTSIFIERTRDHTYIIFSLFNVNHA